MRLRIKVKPNSHKDEVVKEPDGSLTVRIKAPPIEGKANKYLAAFLADYLRVSRPQITILKGRTNPFKTMEIDAKDDFIRRKLEL